MGSLFLSHSSKDKPFVRKLSNDLQRMGHYTWIDEAEIKVGDSLIEKIQNGIAETDYLGVVLSRNSIESEWVKREVNIALTQEINGKFYKVLPIRIDDCRIPLFLSDKKYADFTTDDKYKSSLEELASVISTPPMGKSKTSISESEIEILQKEISKLKDELNLTRGEKRRAISRLEKERESISPELKKAIENEYSIYPEFDDINKLYAFQTSGIPITAGYLLHCIRKERMKGYPHQIVFLCELEHKNDELGLLLDATFDRIRRLDHTIVAL